MLSSFKVQGSASKSYCGDQKCLLLMAALFFYIAVPTPKAWAQG